MRGLFPAIPRQFSLKSVRIPAENFLVRREKSSPTRHPPVMNTGSKGRDLRSPLSLPAPPLFGFRIPPGKKFVKGLVKPGEKAYDKGTIKGESAGAG